MPSAAPPGESINRRFRTIVSAIYLVIMALMLWQFATQWRGYRDAQEAQKQFNVVKAALHAMAAVSSERRPAVGVLLLDGAQSDRWRIVLVSARQMTDHYMDELDRSVRDGNCQYCSALQSSSEGARTQLADARQRLDALQHAPRTDAQIVEGFGRIVAVIPRLSAIAENSSTGVIRENADVQSYLLVARLSGLLREQAGLIAQQFAPSLVKHRPLTAQESLDISGSMGKIEQLRQLLMPSLRVLPPALRQDFAELDRRFFGEAMTRLEDFRQQQARPAGTDATLLQLSDWYGPLVLPIDRFRDNALSLAGETIDESLHRHLLYLLASGALTVLLTAFLLIMVWRFREKVIRPFFEARRMILAVASGDPVVELPRGNYGSEVQDLFAALDVLKKNDTKRRQLELERTRLIGELQTMAETDPLTSLLNRRAFESRARVLLSDQRGGEAVVALMMLDIDFFKRVNDTYGHDSGDKALVALATLCRESVRSEDIVARFGGEEFVILLRVQAAAQARSVAETVRQRLHDTRVTASDDRVFGFTVSIGIAVAARGSGEELQVDELLREADALLYRAKDNGRDRIEMPPGD